MIEGGGFRFDCIHSVDYFKYEKERRKIKSFVEEKM